MIRTTSLALAVGFGAAAPVWAAPAGEYGFFSLRNTDFVMTIAFTLFVVLLLWLRVPGRIGAMLDNRAESIRRDLAEARSLREEAQALLASFERRQAEMAEQAARIVADARAEAERASVEAQAEAERAVARRIRQAEEQLEAAERRAIREVRDRAAAVAVEAAREVLAAQIGPEQGARLLDESIDTVAARLH
ncbi:ATP F0F1 synthase subunit B [Rubellimicrobium sp. CFH 75288]|uniref:F0F1 ATP synthase subunit B family protein n=1 Tax=Rubellimicrobium sp. CFH 75288 TaxID=2697034 RepID=UPI001412D3A6|nr:ATP F0F1 synthase subunit B [Rubellimicrobium sp. CFH 75288]NAZ37574.1 ATP F0F1 synthase subunit B [Rubellimicrobium sp. CFH 75288]